MVAIKTNNKHNYEKILTEIEFKEITWNCFYVCMYV